MDSLSSLTYESRLLGFIDILGWKSVVANSVQQPDLMLPIQKAIATISEQARCSILANVDSVAYGPRYFQDVQVSQFSDTFVISALAKAGCQVSIAMSVSRIARDLLEAGFCCRGAIVEGLVVHRGNRLYGPALIEAHELECNVAKYPRIIVSPSAAKWLECLRCVQTDGDGLIILDIFRDYVLNDGKMALGRIRANLEDKLRSNGSNLGLAAKYRWLLNRVNDAEVLAAKHVNTPSIDE